MAEAVVAYDRDLPEIPGRRLWERPESYLVKDDAAPTGWREDTTWVMAMAVARCRRGLHTGSAGRVLRRRRCGGAGRPVPAGGPAVSGQVAAACLRRLIPAGVDQARG